MTTREKMTGCVKRSTKEIVDWFYELGVEERLPKKWEEFKEELIVYCTEQGLDAISKYRDELCSAYVQRLKDIVLYEKMDEKLVFKKLRKEKAPRDYQILFYAMDSNLG